MFVRALPLVLSLLVAACGSRPAPSAPAASVQQDNRVGVHVSTRWTFATSSYWIEGPSGLVLIDTQFLPAVGIEAVEHAEKSTGKKVVAAIVLHANPDKFNGTAALQARGIKVLTSQQVAALIPAVHEKRLAAFGERYAPDYPKAAPRPDVFGDRTTELTLAGLKLRAHVLGAGCSEAHVAIEFDGHFFVGDLVGNGGHAWLELGLVDEWLKRIAELRTLSPKRVHPGRGASGGPELLDAQEKYLRTVLEIVAAENPKAVDDEAGIERATAKIIARYPDHEWKVFLQMGVPALWNRQVH
jgi:glyoxylase-like metal-dependent hydrolase (beta-lactamase superfamily II)